MSSFVPGKTLLAFDYDGTLTPYFTDPERVYTPPGIAKVMKHLAALTPVAVVSGRAVRSLRRRLGFPAAYLVGNHGIDGLASSRRKLPAARKTTVSWERELKALQKAGFFPQGVRLEDKKYSLTLHYRQSRNPRAARIAIQKAISRLRPKPRVVRGKYVFNCVPAGLPHKGDALREIQRLSRTKNVFFIGDDVTDEDVFRNAPKHWVTVRVGHHSQSAARFSVPGFRDVERLLLRIESELRRKQS